eukprot:CAMPEP_0183703694 /NCGR_PEP_ID=MMETSP0737-20130205/1346_1 /TAXON_ID=385413 /ORGANISM="Thalassiosira miniscula, Strain CCMP1093" /LENGTH=79 /DNA_ID=CAMNT_0025930491 /DNA_START=458 /DNA_END=697 /DNA_ORIENTATION=+
MAEYHDAMDSSAVHRGTTRTSSLGAKETDRRCFREDEDCSDTKDDELASLDDESQAGRLRFVTGEADVVVAFEEVEMLE